MNLNLEHANVTYKEKFLSNELEKKIFEEISDIAKSEETQKVKIDDSCYKLKRKTIVYIHNSIADTYILPKIWGDDVSVFEFTPELCELKSLLEAELHYEFNICLANYYSTGKNNIGWHSDNEEKGDIECIASISIGAEREFAFRQKNTKDILKTINLDSGSLLIMDKGCQEYYEHCLLPNKEIKQPRLNLTFRNFKFDSYVKT